MSNRLQKIKSNVYTRTIVLAIMIYLISWVLFSAIAGESYLFSWDKVPGNDSDKLIIFLEKNQGGEWLKKAKIEKINDDRVVTISEGRNLYSLSLNEEKTKAILKTNSKETQEYTVKMENGKLNIYGRFNIAKQFIIWIRSIFRGDFSIIENYVVFPLTIIIAVLFSYIVVTYESIEPQK